MAGLDLTLVLDFRFFGFNMAAGSATGLAGCWIAISRSVAVVEERRRRGEKKERREEGEERTEVGSEVYECSWWLGRRGTRENLRTKPNLAMSVNENIATQS